MPHSVPACTSLTSSLNRRSDSSSPWKTTTLSRSTRIGLARLTAPSTTRQPAIAPSLDERNTSLTSKANDLFLDLGAQQTGNRLLDVVDRLVDDAVVVQVEIVLADRLARRGIGTDVEADDDRIGRLRQRGIGSGDAADARRNHVDLDLLVG